MSDSGSHLFGATSDGRMMSSGFHLLQWRMKARGNPVYDQNGIDPGKNPGTYEFKKGLAEIHCRELSTLGRFDAAGGLLGQGLIQLAERVKRMRGVLKERLYPLRSRIFAQEPLPIGERGTFQFAA